MATLHWRGSTLLGPVPPAMVTVKDPAKKSGGNIITVAWTGIINTHPPKAYISVRPQRYSYRLLCDTRECIIHLTTRLGTGCRFLRHAHRRQNGQIYALSSHPDTCRNG